MASGLKSDHPVGFQSMSAPSGPLLFKYPKFTLHAPQIHPKPKCTLWIPIQTAYNRSTCSAQYIPTVDARSSGQFPGYTQYHLNRRIEDAPPSNCPDPARSSHGQISSPLRTDPHPLLFLALSSRVKYQTLLCLPFFFVDSFS